MSQIPRVTIVTVVFNSRDLLARTIGSVDELDYNNIEHVIVDGGSTDGSADLLYLRRHVKVCGISERDDGIYDAMNKGIQMATGDYIWFLNAGDVPSDRSVLKPLEHFNNLDVLYGDTNLVNDMGVLTKVVHAPSRISWQIMTEGMFVSHQSIIVRRKIAPKYDLSYRFIADQKWIVEILRQAKSIRYAGQPVCNYLINGVSQKFYFTCLLEKIRYSFRVCPLSIAIKITFFDLLNAIRFYLSRLLRWAQSKLITMQLP